jgi:hypothetical protein
LANSPVTRARASSSSPIGWLMSDLGGGGRPGFVLCAKAGRQNKKRHTKSMNCTETSPRAGFALLGQIIRRGKSTAKAFTTKDTKVHEGNQSKQKARDFILWLFYLRFLPRSESAHIR